MAIARPGDKRSQSKRDYRVVPRHKGATFSSRVRHEIRDRVRLLVDGRFLPPNPRRAPSHVITARVIRTVDSLISRCDQQVRGAKTAADLAGCVRKLHRVDRSRLRVGRQKSH